MYSGHYKIIVVANENGIPKYVRNIKCRNGIIITTEDINDKYLLKFDSENRAQQYITNHYNELFYYSECKAASFNIAKYDGHSITNYKEVKFNVGGFVTYE